MVKWYYIIITLGFQTTHTHIQKAKGTEYVRETYIVALHLPFSLFDVAVNKFDPEDDSVSA